MLGILIGYLLGSVSPAYFLGKLLKGIDIRKVRDKNAGTTNVWKVLGFWPAVVTGVYDFSKGLLSMLIAWKLGFSEVWIYSSGLSATVGHVFPFYLDFRGGQGSATSLGILLFLLYGLLKDEFLPLQGLALLLVVILTILAITRQKLFLPLIAMPALSVMLYKNREISLPIIFVSIIIAQYFFLCIYLAWQEKIFVLKKKTLEKILPWRSILRPLAVIFPLAYFFLEKNIILYVIGGLGVVPILFDSIRLLNQKINIFFFTKNKKILKKGEEGRFSSISLFFISIFLVLLIFPKSIAIVALCFIIFGDLFAKFFGLEYGQIKIFGSKTLEGSLAFLLACLLSGYLLWPYVGLSAAAIISGIMIATIVEALPLDINDNFSVALFSSSIMYIVERFF